ncbi:AraD1 family protein [Facilibium subflavum]|uniref:AraD1 family protein n=1 Tax=Facilibium subflavum TaxID=2219058 RepID=UPI002286FE77|nr:AraD1 family protein [Facilibium subflavum]
MQYKRQDGMRRTAIVKDQQVHLLDSDKSIYQLAKLALTKGGTLLEEINGLKTINSTYVSDFLKLNHEIMTPISIEDTPWIVMSGTGLTHINSALMRDNMMDSTGKLSDAQKIYHSGLENGKPSNKDIGAMPEWFFKGFGNALKPSYTDLSIPAYALGGGEEAELAVMYIIDDHGNPCRLGFCLGNEFSDHLLEQQNHYYLAQSKLRQCSIGSELYIGPPPEEVTGEIKIVRAGEIIWQKAFHTGFKNMTHSLQNIEQQILKYDIFRQPGAVHVFFLGADQTSFADKIVLQDGDTVSIKVDLFDISLVNNIIEEAQTQNIQVKYL